MLDMMDWSQRSPANAVVLDQGCSINFLCRDWKDCLPSFDVATQSLDKIYEQLTVYSDVLYRNYSLALARGATLTCTGISNRLADMFSIPSPTMIEGAPVTWTELVLSLGSAPSFMQLASIQSRIQIASEDQDLILTGRPWRFLSPWPGTEDCNQELQALQATQEELTCIYRNARQVCESIPKLIGQIEHRKALFRMVIEPNIINIRSPCLSDAATPSAYESRALTPSPILTGENENENEAMTVATSLSSLVYSVDS